MYRHEPVLLQPALKFLQPQPNHNFIDATLGGGGYSMALLKTVMPKGKVLSIDMDQDAIDNYSSQLADKPYRDNAIAVHANFVHLQSIVSNHNFDNIQGIVADIGLSSYQIDQAGRGLSFQKDEPLDMRFDLSSQGDDARFLLNDFSEQELARIFREYGEERLAGKIARAIVRQRQEVGLLHKTTDLVDAIKTALPKPQAHRWADTARRVFQALRIAVNHELESLEAFLPQALDLLNPGGTLVVVTFHSLEDRIVKQFFVEANRGCICPIDFPQCICGKNPRAKILTRKPVTAEQDELDSNPRSKSAKLRAIVKL